MSRTEASKILKDSLRTIAPSAFRMFAPADCYGNVNVGENETTFNIGLGPTSFVTANGKIAEIGPDISEISYNFEGPFFLFLMRYSIDSQIMKIFKAYRLLK